MYAKAELPAAIHIKFDSISAVRLKAKTDYSYRQQCMGHFNFRCDDSTGFV